MSFSEISKPHYSPDELAGILRDINLEAGVETQGDGRKVIMVTAPGLRFAIFTHGPKGDADIVTTVTFRAYFAIQTTFEEVNEWNLAKRFVSAYRDADGELALEWDVLVQHTSPAYFVECFRWWGTVVSDVTQYPLARGQGS
jgi:hypothetical protein